jgi:RNAse (barnase) inhibitor barstar
MRTVLLDGDGDRAEILRRLAVHLGLRPVGNLDALWDALRTEARGPFEIVWRDHARARAALGEDFARLDELFRRLVVERRDVRVTFV